MSKRTPLYDLHLEMGAKMVDFGGWDMPLRYGSQIEEHHQVRKAAGMFDVSHMSIVDFTGPDVKALLQYLFANDVARLKTPGKALYTCMLNHDGHVLDDLIIYYMNDNWYRIVFNAATHDKDIAWVRSQMTDFDVSMNEQSGAAMIAVQGPKAPDAVVTLFDDAEAERIHALKPFNAIEVDDCFVARTGYTGEDGYEIIVDGSRATDMWRALTAEGVKPIGLGARDSLRLEAGMNLYGSDMDETTTPLVAGLGWTIAWEPADRDFIGRKAIEAQKAAGVPEKFVGLLLEGKGVLRAHQIVNVEGIGQGEITSGGFSPTLDRSIAFARVPAATGEHCTVDIRGKQVPAKVVRTVFVRNGKSCL